MWNDKWSPEGLSLIGRANFDPDTLRASVGNAALTAGGLGGQAIA
jgi:hypothetical protein